MTVRPSEIPGSDELARALSAVRDGAAALWLAARNYADAVAAETDALVAYAATVAAAGGEAEVRAARDVLAYTLGRRDDAGRRLGLDGGSPALVRAEKAVLDVVRTMSGDGAATVVVDQWPVPRAVAEDGVGELQRRTTRGEQLERWLATATQFVLRAGGEQVTVETRGADRWAVLDGRPGQYPAQVLTRTGQWEWEPAGSDRDEEFLSRARFTFPEAFERAAAVLAADTCAVNP
ncbi:hypothetical protein [Frankia sp. Cas3]|uniref:hypothetical protein n=1 Tax=Frankia sp. Cas3 TaxID=3073926 RepID=UPI002AD3D5B0|nr:hypothetical protein [Frankia sp. Cas3]